MIIDTLRNSLKLIDRNKIIAIHLSQEDYDEIAKESYVELDKNPKNNAWLSTCISKYAYTYRGGNIMYFYFLIKAIKVLSFIFLIAVAIVLAILLKKK